MIDPATARALERIATVQSDIAGGYTSGFEPRTASIAGDRAPAPDTDALSVAAPSGAYFVVGDARAPQFTRDGGFRLVDGELRTAAGAPVLGTAPGSKALAPLRLDPLDRALGRAQSVHIEGDGSLAYTRTSLDPLSGERVTEHVSAGRVALARFPAGTRPVANADGSVAPPIGTSVQIGLPAESTGGLVTYSRDVGRVDIRSGLGRLHEAYLMLDAVRAAGKAHGNAEQTALDLVK